MSAKDAPAAKRQKHGETEGDDGSTSLEVSLKGTFIKDLLPMMYGFGDDECPLPETADLMEAIVIEYASGVLRKALDRGSQRGRLKAGGKPTGPPPVDDILAVVRSDSKKALRVKELLSMQNYVRDALRALEDKPEEALADFVPEERGG